MTQFQTSVFYNGYFLSYLVSTEDKNTFHFALKSKPDMASYAPEQFIVNRTNNGWQANIDLNPDFEKSLFSHLKASKV